jgi:hypothetical protein
VEEHFNTIGDHIVILGWSSRVSRIISELRNEVHGDISNMRPILVVTPESEHSINIPYEKVYVIHGRANDPEVLRRGKLCLPSYQR